MAKSSRARSVKVNNRRLKADVFGPVESARAERLSAKLLELAAQPKPQKEAGVHMDAEIAGETVEKVVEAPADSSMDVDGAAPKKSSSSKRAGSGRIQKKKKTSRIVFPKYKDSKGKKKKA